MKNKMVVRICTGTLCYVMGGAQLQLLDEHLDPETLSRLDIKGSPCLGYCNSGDSLSAPYVEIDGVRVGSATLESVIEIIKSKLAEKQ